MAVMTSSAARLPPNVPLNSLFELLVTTDKMLESVFHRDRQGTLNTVVRHVHDLLNAEGCAIFLIEETSPRTLRLSASCTDLFGMRVQDNVLLPVRSVRKGGLTGHVAAHGHPVNLSGKAYRTNLYRKRVVQQHLKSGQGFSYLGIPLKDRKGRLIGVVTVDNKKGLHGIPNSDTAFDKADEVLARILSTQIVLVLESLRRVELMTGLVEDMQNARDTKKLLSAILTRAIMLVRGDRGDFALYDPLRDDLIIEAVEGKRSKSTLPIDRPLPDRCFMRTVWNKADTNSAVVDNVRSLKDGYYKSHPHTSSEVAIRFESDGRPIGVLNVEGFEQSAFDSQDVELLLMLSRYASVAVQFGKEETSLWSLMERLLEFAEPRQAALTNILDVVRQIYRFDAGLIYIADEEAGLLRCQTTMGCDAVSNDSTEFAYRFDEDALATRIFRGEKGFENGYFSRNPGRDKNFNSKGLTRFDIKSSPLLGLPLRFGTRVVGVLVVWARHGRFPTPGDLEHLKPLAKLAACKIAVWASDRQREESKELYRSLVESLPQCIFRKDLDGRFTYANHAFCQSLGQHWEQIRGRTDLDFYPRSMAREYVAMDRAVMNSGEARETEEQNRPRRGETTKWVHVTKIPIRDMTNKIAGIQGIFWDITDRKMREWLLEVLPDAIITERAGSIAMVSDSAVRLLGARDASQIVGIKLSRLIPHARHIRSLRQLLRKGGKKAFKEVEFRRSDGKRIDFELTACAFTDGGGKELLLVAHDITTRKRQTRELMEANQEKERRLNEIHHRVLNNLNRVNQLFSLQARHLKAPALRKACEESQGRIKVMGEVHRLLYQSRSKDKVNMSEYLKRLIDSLFKAQAMNGLLKYALQVDDGLFMDIDTATNCGLIINELISNSIKHAFPYKARSRIDISLSRHDQQIRMSVSDNGCGLPKDLEPESASTLGFKLIASLAKRELKGKMQISREGGTRVSIEFPERPSRRKDL
jgi:PAS domain S-box-containing protein